jgi:hypothetical protein
MGGLLFLAGMAGGAYSGFVLLNATTPFHQIYGATAGVVGAVLFVGGAIVHTIENLPAYRADSEAEAADAVGDGEQQP